MSTVQNQKILYKNETFTLSTYNGFKIIIRDSDGFINASYVVKQINDKEKTKKQIKTLFKSVQYQDFENYLKTILPGKELKYNLNDVVVYGNKWWAATQVNRGQQPQAGSNYWTQILTALPAMQIPVTTTQPTDQTIGDQWYQVI